MRKFGRIAIIFCLSVAAVLAVLCGSLWLWIWYKTSQVEGFYQEHRALHEMRAVQKQSTNDSASAREALLQIVPLGADKEAALAVLRIEGFGCQTIAEPITDTRLRQRLLQARGLANPSDSNRKGKSWVDCQIAVPDVFGYNHWIVDLEFDADGRLGDAGVAMWNIFL
jgi:hypothetical protein